MTRYMVQSEASGLALGIFEADDAEGAIAAMLRDARCDDAADPDLVARELDEYEHAIHDGRGWRTVRRYRLACDGADEIVEAEDDEDAIEQCKDWLESGDFDTSQPCRVHGRVYRIRHDGEEEDVGDVTIDVEAEEPPCVGDHLHEWSSDHDLVGGIEESPGVWGHGGGVIIREVCLWCGRTRITDTWATDPETGEQGIRQVRWDEGMDPDDDRLRAGRVRAGLEEGDEG